MNTRVLAVAIAGLLYAGLPAQAQPRTAVAEIKGCTDARITGRAHLSEIPSPAGVKQVLVALTVNGLPDGKHGVHMHETANCQPCAAAGGHFDPGPASHPLYLYSIARVCEDGSSDHRYTGRHRPTPLGS
jgi:Cu-Zn family superoxide dismutase